MPALAARFLAAAACAFHFFSMAFTPFLNWARRARVWALLGVAAVDPILGFEAYLAFGPESEGWAVIGLGDFDGDSRTELLWRNSNSSQVSSWTMAGAYLNFGPESDGWSVVDIGDYDGDGLAELLWRNSITSQVSSWTMAGSFINFGIEGGGWHLKLF